LSIKLNENGANFGDFDQEEGILSSSWQFHAHIHTPKTQKPSMF
jgi:hypothetical protein